jgi:hypothetical protein
VSEQSKSAQQSRRSIVNEPQPETNGKQHNSRRSVIPPVVTMPSSPPPPTPTPQPPMDTIRRSERVRRQPDRFNL